MNLKDAQSLIESVPHWHHVIDFGEGAVTPGAYDPRFMLELLKLPHDLHGSRILDVGASDGFFAQALHRRGADVVCLDYRAKTSNGFHVMEKIYGHSFEHHNINVYDIDASHLGKFDIVLFLGVLYHLPDMMRALNTLRSISLDKLFVETLCDVAAPEGVSTARYCVGSSFGGDITNFWAPSKTCLEDMLSDCAFSCARTESWGDRLLAEAIVSKEDGASRKMGLAYGRLAGAPNL